MGKVKARCTLKDVSMWVERVVTRDEKDVISKEEAQVVSSFSSSSSSSLINK